MAIKFYQVGGSVRDTLLTRPYTERDWLVVGADESDMNNRGYKPVGKHFPVFLHPETKEEYALARQETKVDEGHGGFKFVFDRSVSINQDLIRRDLTINALVVPENAAIARENVIDLHNGLADIDSRTLRHISDAFSEDPLRLYRVARFYAQLDKYGFSIAEETQALLKEIVKANEPLSEERIWTETLKAMASDAPWKYWKVLQECGALESKFPQFCNEFDKRLNRLHVACDANLSAVQRLTAMHLPDVDEKIASGLPNISKIKEIVNFYLQNAKHDNVFVSFDDHLSPIEAMEWLEKNKPALEKLYMSTSASNKLVSLAYEMVKVLDRSKISRTEEPYSSYMTILSSIDNSDISTMQKVCSAYLGWRDILPGSFDQVFKELNNSLGIKQYDFMQLLKWRVVLTVLEHEIS